VRWCSLSLTPGLSRWESSIPTATRIQDFCIRCCRRQLEHYRLACAHIGELLKYYRRLNDQLAGLLYINANATQFVKGIGLFDKRKLDEEIEITRDEQDKIREQAQECASGRYRECVVRKTLALLPLPTSRVVGPNVIPNKDLQTIVFKPIPGLQTGPNDKRVLVVEGEWNARNGGSPQPAALGNTLIKFADNVSGKVVCYRYKGPVLVPPSTAVSIMVEDQYSQDSYNDNGQSSTNPLETYFYEPIFLEGLALPDPNNIYI
jgi:hypothetical protein